MFFVFLLGVLYVLFQGFARVSEFYLGFSIFLCGVSGLL